MSRALPALSSSSDDELVVESVRQGAHFHGAGAVPEALQEVIRNMSRVLSKAAPRKAIADMLESRKRRKPPTVCKLLFACLLIEGEGSKKSSLAHSDRSYIDHTISALTGMSLNTVHNVLGRLRKNSHRAQPLRGVGGRPVKRASDGREKFPAAEQSALPDCEELLQDMIDPAFVGLQPADAEGMATSGGAMPALTVSDIGIRVGRLAAWLYRSYIHCLFSLILAKL